MPKRSSSIFSQPPWSLPVDKVIYELDVDTDSGLSPEDVRRRQATYGRNLLRKARRRSAWRILVDQFESIIIGLLAVAAVVAWIYGERVEAVAIGIAIVVNAGIGFVTEMKAVQSMDALRKLSRVAARVRRTGEVSEIAAQELVPGDTIELEGGDVVTADLRIIESAKLQANESALTGESVPVAKNTETVDPETPLSERSNMLFKGTAITRGSGAGVVVATGMDTELGEISALVQEAEEETTPLERRLDGLGRSLIWITLGLTGLVAVIGILRGRDVLLMIESAIALAVAAVPEGLPIVATIALARGMMRMAHRNALINRLAAVETLGSTTIICTDKTGTLTKNRMTATRLVLPGRQIDIRSDNDDAGKPGFYDEAQRVDPKDDRVLAESIRVGVLCNNASLSSNNDSGKSGDSDDDGDGVGDPMEIALLRVGRMIGLRRRELHDIMPEKREEAFSSDSKMMATFHEKDGHYFVAVKGAPESLVEVCTSTAGDGDGSSFTDHDKTRWLETNEELAKEGLRVLALAKKEVSSTDANPYRDLTFLGLIAFVDPPRRDVKEAIATTRRAGVRVVMVTGDQRATAAYIARELGIISENSGSDENVLIGKELDGRDLWSEQDRERRLKASVFARVSPEQKLSLISLHQDNGDIVAMTGDGVNDAPALKKANIGVAMGRRGTQVARETADMILKDDRFSTIVSALRHGRIIFNNVRKFVLYLLSGNVAEILAVGAASLANAPLPLLPLQILFLNFVLDVFPALALGVGEGDPRVMKQPPRDPSESVLTTYHWVFIGSFGFLIALCVLGALFTSLTIFHMPANRAVTISFLTAAFGRLWHVFNMRESGSAVLHNEVTENKWLWTAVLLCVSLLLAAVYIPGLSSALSVSDPGIRGWALIIVFSIIPLIGGQFYRSLSGREMS